MHKSNKAASRKAANGGTARPQTTSGGSTNEQHESANMSKTEMKSFHVKRMITNHEQANVGPWSESMRLLMLVELKAMTTTAAVNER